ncbi:hypothetical protein GJ496_003739 [Pomphorhynchus laevis]|nr:hypothetical protein GJ496_003739 [Pomphorhynchus laevis]
MDQITSTYYSRYNELSYENIILLGLQRIKILKSLKTKALETLHIGHPGVSSTKNLARYYCWWPTISNDIDHFVRGCSFCQTHRPTPAHQPLNQWDIPSRSWMQLHVDFAGPIGGQMYLATIWDRFKPTVESPVKRNREKQNERHDQSAKPRWLKNEQSVWIRNPRTSEWNHGQEGELRRRHVDDLHREQSPKVDDAVKNRTEGVHNVFAQLTTEPANQENVLRRSYRTRRDPVRYDELAVDRKRRDMAASVRNSFNE